MTSLETYQTRFDEHAWQVFRRVLQTAGRVGHAEINEFHLLRELLDAEGAIFSEFFRQLAIDPLAFRAQLEQQMNAKIVSDRVPMKLDSNLIELLKFAWNRALAHGRDRMTIIDLLAAFAQASESSLVRLLETFGADGIHISTAMLACLKQRETEIGISSSETDDSELPLRRGDVVRITSGPFGAFTGRVHQANPSRSTVTVSVNALGKQQTVELPISEVQKLQFG